MKITFELEDGTSLATTQEKLILSKLENGQVALSVNVGPNTLHLCGWNDRVLLTKAEHKQLIDAAFVPPAPPQIEPPPLKVVEPYPYNRANNHREF